MSRQALEVLQALLKYCEAESWRGYDPYDGLNSRLVRSLPFESRMLKLLVTQGCKRLPLNPRRVLGVPRETNAKALGLFTSSYARLRRCTGDAHAGDAIRRLAHLLEGHQAAGFSGCCWGYNFDWQSRTTFVPRGTPNVISTVFVANALLDAAEVLGVSRYADMARSACDFVLFDLNRTEDRTGVCFSYTPLDNTQVYNASLLAGALLARVHRLTGDSELRDIARQALRFCVARQNADGSWYYSPLPWHQWVDNIHTGFNLTAISDYEQYASDDEFHESLVAGFRYYLTNLFTREDLIPKYYDTSLYPIDIHGIAQSVVTLVRLGGLDRGNMGNASTIVDWAIRNMQDRSGFFYFQKHRTHTNRIDYMRWSQAWMCYALSHMLEAEPIGTSVPAGQIESDEEPLSSRASCAGDEKRLVRELAANSGCDTRPRGRKESTMRGCRRGGS